MKNTKTMKKILLAFTIFFISIVAILPVDTYARTGYHTENWNDSCAYEDITVGTTQTHSIGHYSTNYSTTTCGACRQNVRLRTEYYGYNCNGWQHTGTSVNIEPGKYNLGVYCSGTHNGIEGRGSGSVTCDKHKTTTRRYYCRGHEVANSYTVYYRTSASGSTGSGSYGARYDSGFSLHNGSGFSRTWPVNFVDSGTGSTTATSSVQYSKAQIIGWSYNSNNYSLGQYGTWNFTATHGGSVTLTARWGSFSQVTVPTITKPGYTLLGYTNDESKSGVKMDGSTADVILRAGDTVAPTAIGEKWYAIWKPNVYDIAFDGNTLKYDVTHATTIAGKLFNEFYVANTSNVATVTGSTTTLKDVKFDGSFTMPFNGFSKTSLGYYGQTVNYNLVGWSQSKFSSYDSVSRVTSTTNNRGTVNYYGYYPKTTLLNLAYATYTSGSKTVNSIYFYPNETIKNYMYNGNKNQYNLSLGSETITLYANWVPDNERPYTYFRLATKQYNEDGTWNNYIEDIAYDEDPESIYDYNGDKAIVYDDMPIYLDTTYYDPEGRVDEGQFIVDYQYSIDNGTTWYELKPNLDTPNFTTKLVTMNTSNLSNSKNLDGTYVIDNSAAKNIMYGYNYANTSTTTYMLEVIFKSDTDGKTTLIRNRASDTVTYPTTLTNVVRNESTNSIESSTTVTLQKPLWSTGYYSKSYVAGVLGTNVNEYTGTPNTWDSEKAFVQNTSVGKTTGDNAGWYTKEITCYLGNSTTGGFSVVADFDNASDMTYPMYDYTTNQSYLLVSLNNEYSILSNYDDLSVENVLKYRGYVKTLDNGETVDWTTKYASRTNLILQSLSDVLGEDNINRKYSVDIPADESIGFINISVDKDSYKHYDSSANPTYDIDQSYGTKYYHNGDDVSTVQFDNQFSLYFISIYDVNGNEVLSQAAGNVTSSYDANGTPTNGSQYTFTTDRTGLESDLVGHIYTSYDDMIADLYTRTGALFSEYSDLLNGTYTIYLGVCDKSWNIYSPNKWSIEKSELVVEPRLSIKDIRMEEFSQTGYKNEFVLDSNGNETTTPIASTVWLKTLNGVAVETEYNGNVYKFPMYRLSAYTLSASLNGNKIYTNNFSLTQKEQAKLSNTDYVLDTSLGWTNVHNFTAKYGYNFTLNVDVQNADYIKVEYRSIVDDSIVTPIVQREDEYIGNVDGGMLYNCTRYNGTKSFTVSFPEQSTVSGVYAKVYVYKNTITNTLHPIASSTGTTTLTRTLTIGDKNHPIVSFSDTVLEDIGVDVVN